MNNKYELINKQKNGLYQIRALKSFNGITEGSLGGFIESEKNLSHTGNAWIYGNAQVRNNANVSGNAVIRGNSIIDGNATIDGNAKVYGNATIFGNAAIYGDAIVHNANVNGNAKVFGNAFVHETPTIHGNAQVYGNAIVHGNAIINENVKVTNKVLILDYETYLVTITDNHMRIGCKVYTFSEWFSFSDEAIDEMDSNALEWWYKWKPVLELLVENKKQLGRSSDDY
jgi:carbonic anhydrase/acetyltransferase-like protein (isoleucine patch superfamily)